MNADYSRLDQRIDKLFAAMAGNFGEVQARLDRIEERIDNHLSNHHGLTSKLKQTGLAGAIVSLTIFLIEVFRHFFA